MGTRDPKQEVRHTTNQHINQHREWSVPNERCLCVLFCHDISPGVGGVGRGWQNRGLYSVPGVGDGGGKKVGWNVGRGIGAVWEMG